MAFLYQYLQSEHAVIWLLGQIILGQLTCRYLSVLRRRLRIRKRFEEAFGWITTVAGQRKTKFKGPDRVGCASTFSAAADAGLGHAA